MATAPADRRPLDPIALAAGAGSSTAPGLVLATLDLDPIYTNSVAIQILGYPRLSAANAPNVGASIRRILNAERFTASSTPAAFVSGRRRYICRSVVLESHVSHADPHIVALLFERQPRDPLPLTEMSRRFRLSPRETETMRHLIDGLTTKEAAQRMNVSPNTVKQFVRIAMGKLGVTTRSGMVGKILGR